MPAKPSVVIPAAGCGKRMRSFGPKVLLKVGGETILERQVRLVRAVFPGASIVVVAGFAADKVRRCLPRGVRVVENTSPEETNVAASVAIGLAASPPGGVLVVYGDLVFNRAALEPFSHLDREASAVLIDRGEARHSEVGVSVAGQRACHFCHGLPARWGQVAYLSEDDRRRFRAHAASPGGARMFGYEILNRLAEGETLRALEAPGMMLAEVDCSKDLALARTVAAMGG